MPAPAVLPPAVEAFLAGDLSDADRAGFLGLLQQLWESRYTGTIHGTLHLRGGTIVKAELYPAATTLVFTP